MHTAARVTKQQIDLHTNLAMAVLLIAVAISSSVQGVRQASFQDIDTAQLEASAALLY